MYIASMVMQNYITVQNVRDVVMLNNLKDYYCPLDGGSSAWIWSKEKKDKKCWLNFLNGFLRFSLIKGLILSVILIGSVVLSVHAGNGTPTSNQVSYYKQLLIRCDDANEKLLSDSRNLASMNMQKDKEIAVLRASRDERFLFLDKDLFIGICIGAAIVFLVK